ncbi:hypothetical protein [Butyrivibrio sp. INlla16]|uniref:hypothetical protein n=1 Tax=Butyrivibrio sp. INlla16 TaxID=1520807 RepID=UPI00088C7245|nr:hypothetical protein [Butyrivibrio sp. INlla16]SDB10026.1 hypothetical protein SAMN02910263_00449 [Butyrivibrio sp. INlla16]
MSFSALGIRIDREKEVITECDLPPIFTDIPSQEYELLSPLSANAFIEEERKKMIYLEPERFGDASDDTWNAYFFSEEPDGYFKDAHMDLSVIVPLSKQANLRHWEKSKPEKVKEYILTMTSLR